MGRINPKVDLIFKKLFGSEENTDILKSLVNSILPENEQVVDLVLKNPYNLADYVDGKLSILDIKAQDAHGKYYDIEMQIKGHEFYGKRALFYWAKMYANQFEDGQGYRDLKKCIVMSLIDFNYFDDKRYLRRMTLKDFDTDEFHENMNYIDLYFVELKKFNNQLAPIRTVLERWIAFLNNAYKYGTDNLPTELAQIQEIKKAANKLEIMYLDKRERDHYEAQQKAILDEEARMDSPDWQVKFMEKMLKKAEANVQQVVEQLKNAESNALQVVEKLKNAEEQKQKLEEQARNAESKAKDAEKQAKKILVLNAISSGLDNQTISAITGFSFSEIDALRKKN